MGRRRAKGRPISGWLVLDKPADVGSTEAVSKIKWLFQAQKAGHAGTLDPLASGMLPIALGDATKTVPYVMDGQKTYRFTITWGAETSTDDLEGEFTKQSEQRPTREAVEQLLPSYTGCIQQVPPAFSAVKINGERAYDLARDGEEVVISAREVEIFRFDMLNFSAEQAEFEIDCGKGTYVRALARDLGRDLGCCGHISALRRPAVDPFEENQLISYADILASEQLEPAERYAKLDSLLASTSIALTNLTEIRVNGDQALRLRRGNPIILRGRDAPANMDDAYVSSAGELVAIGAVENGEFHPRRVFSAPG